MNYYQNYILEILDQIIFWTEISKEHPIVVNTFEELTVKALPKELKKEISEFTKKFNNIQTKAVYLKKPLDDYPLHPYVYDAISQEIYHLLRVYITVNQQWLNTLDKTTEYGKDDKIWQTLLEHITEEQIYASQLMQKYLHYIDVEYD